MLDPKRDKKFLTIRRALGKLIAYSSTYSQRERLATRQPKDYCCMAENIYVGNWCDVDASNVTFFYPFPSDLWINFFLWYPGKNRTCCDFWWSTELYFSFLNLRISNRDRRHFNERISSCHTLRSFTSDFLSPVYDKEFFYHLITTS